MFKNQWSNEELRYLQDNYLEKSNKEMAKVLGRTQKAIQVKLSKLGLVRPDKYFYNKDFFEKIDTEEKAYWLGFLYADGYVALKSANRNAEVGIEIASKDIQHLRKFNKSLQGNVEVHERKRTGVIKPTNSIVSFRLYSKKMVLDLIKHGCVQNKTFIIRFPDISQKLKWAFVRGYFDGDGSVYRDIGRKFIGFNFTSGSKGFLEDLRNFLYKEGIYAYLSVENRKDNRFKETHKSYKLLITGMNNAYCFGQKLYKDANIFLDRKKEKFDLAVEEYNIKQRSINRPYRR